MTARASGEISAVFLLQVGGAALFQHRDDKPGLNHAGLWVPPGGHRRAGESAEECARREFLEETDVRCGELHWLTTFDDHVNGTILTLTVYWSRYDGAQRPVCREGQALAFLDRRNAGSYPIPPYLVDLWDRALAAASAG